MDLCSARQLIEKTPLYIATCDRKCSPHVIVVACAKVIDSRRIIVTDNYMKITRKNLLANTKVEILVYGKGWKGFRINGKAGYHKSGKWLSYVKSMRENKGRPAKGAILITASRITKVE